MHFRLAIAGPLILISVCTPSQRIMEVNAGERTNALQRVRALAG